MMVYYTCYMVPVIWPLIPSLVFIIQINSFHIIDKLTKAQGGMVTWMEWNLTKRSNEYIFFQITKMKIMNTFFLY